MSIPEPIYQTIPSRFLEKTEPDQSENERIFMCHFVFHLGIDKVDRQNTDNMKEAVNNFIINQVDDWMKEKDSEKIEGILNGNLKRLCQAQAFLRNRKSTSQIHWKQVLENHVKLIATYSHILAITLSTFS